VITGAVGVRDRFGESGAPWELIKEFGVSAEHIAQMAAELDKVRHPVDAQHSTDKVTPTR
jgi:transketolase